MSVNCIELMQVWQAGATVKEATGAGEPRLMMTLWLVEPLPAALVAVSVTV